MSAGTATVLRADARALPLPDASVDLVVTSPPYYGQRSYRDGGEHYTGQIGDEPTPHGYIDNLIDCTHEWTRVLKPSGSIFVNLNDKYVADNRGSSADPKRGKAKHAPAGPGGFVGREMARQKSLMCLPERYRIACIDRLGLIVRAVSIWSKPNRMPEKTRERWHRTHEDWVMLTTSPRYYSSDVEIREPHAPWTLKAYRYERAGYARRANRDRVDGGGFKKAPEANPFGKMPGSVMEIATEPLNVPEHIVHGRCCNGVKRDGCEDGIDHFAAYPTEWPRRIIPGWCPPGGVVLDPFGGTGTTALVARVLGRHGISADMSDDYCYLATWRTKDPGQIAKAMRVAPPATQPAGQHDLFGELAS